MKRLLLLLVSLLCTLQGHAATFYAGAQGQTNYYVRIITSTSSSVAVALTEGTSGSVGVYGVVDATLDDTLTTSSTAGGYADGFPFMVFAGSSPSTTANDTLLATGNLKWDGAHEIPIVVTAGKSASAVAGNNAIKLAVGASSTDDWYIGQTVWLTGGTGAGQTRPITTYSGALRTAAVVPNWETNPDTTTTYAIMPTATAAVDAPTAEEVAEEVWAFAVTDADVVGSIGAFVVALVSEAISPDIIDDSRTWTATGYSCGNIVEVQQGFVGTLAMKPKINPATTIANVTAVSITGAATVTATDLEVDRSRLIAHFTVPALSTTGTYTVIVTISTVDGQTIKTRGTLVVR